MTDSPSSFRIEAARTGTWIRAYSGFVILFILGLLHLLQAITFDWPVIFVFAIALLPQIALLVESFKVGPDGLEFRSWEGYRKGDDVDREAKREAVLMPDAQPASGAGAQDNARSRKSAFSLLSDEEKKVVKSLWHFQQASFPADSSQRWGFGVSPLAPDYSSYVSGAVRLLDKGYVTVGHKGMVFLTTNGIEFCRQHDAEIREYPLHYHTFKPA